MITLTFNTSNISAYIFADDTEISATENSTTTPKMIICDLNSTNSTIHHNVTPPEDWTGGKYIFDGTNWSANADWKEPSDENPAEM